MKNVIFEYLSDSKIEHFEYGRDQKRIAAIRTILQKTSLNPMLKEKLSERALKSEKESIEGRLFSKEEIQQRTQRK